VLKGSLRETQYEMPSDSAEPLKIAKASVYGNDAVTYISDDVSPSLPSSQQKLKPGKIGLHKIQNESEDQVAVSLHLYTPPWAEKRRKPELSNPC
jgi:cysteine dioxygenase